MNLLVEIKPDFDGTISITDYSREFNEYIPEETEDVLLRYYNFKYSLTCTIDIILYVSTSETTKVITKFTEHDRLTDSIRIPITKDGHYRITHIVLPTIEWLNKFKDEDLSEYYNLYITDGRNIYKYSEGKYTIISDEEILEVNPFKTTLSILSFDIFNSFNLRTCYINLARQLFDKYPNKCNTINEIDKFNRDFLWMTLNVIDYYLDVNMYSEAQRILEGLSCSNLCQSNSEFKLKKSCGCRKSEKKLYLNTINL